MKNTRHIVRKSSEPVKRGRLSMSEREALARQAKIDMTVGIAGELIEHAFSFRESDANAYSPMDELMRLGLSPYSGIIPGVETVMQHGAKLVERTVEADALRTRYNATTLYGGRGRKVVGYWFVIEGTGFLLSMFSATSTNLDEQNDFTQHLTSLIKQHKIANLYTGPVTRLVRSAGHGQSLLAALKLAGTRVVPHGRMPVDFTERPGDAENQFRKWIEESVSDRNYTVERLTTGALAKAARGYWPKAEEALPALGYKFSPEVKMRNGRPAGFVIPDAAMVPVVRDLLTWGASDMTDEEIVEKLATVHKWGSATLRQRLKNPKATIKDALHPVNALRSIWTQLDVFETGKYFYKSRAAIEQDKLSVEAKERYEVVGQMVFVTHEISFHHDYTNEKGEMVLPNGRWVDDKILKACKRKRARSVEATVAPKVAARHSDDRDRKPLVGLSEWEDEQHQYALSAMFHDSYKLVRRTLENSVWNDRRAGWRADKLETLATIQPAALHRSLAEAIISALSERGTQYKRPGATADASSKRAAQNAKRIASERLALASKRVRAAAIKLEVAAELIETDATPANRSGYTAALSEKNAADYELRAAEQAVAAASETLDGSQPLTRTAEAVVGDLAAAMRVLRDCETRAPAKLNIALRVMLRDMRFSLSDDNLRVVCSVRILLATSDEGAIELGPVTCEVPNMQRVSGEHRREAILAYYLRDGKTYAEIEQLVGVSSDIIRRRLFEELVDSGFFPSKGLRAAICDCQVPQTRRVIWAEMRARRGAEKVELPGVSKAFAAHVVATYFDQDTPWSLSWCSDDASMAREAVKVVRAAGKKGINWTTLLEAVAPDLASGGPVRGLGIELLHGKGTDRRDRCVEFAPVLEHTDNWHAQSNDTRRVWLRRCTYCETQTLTHVLRVPEVPGGLLCTKCKRADSLPEVKFPEEYLLNWVGPRGYGERKRTQRSVGSTVAE